MLRFLRVYWETAIMRATVSNSLGVVTLLWTGVMAVQTASAAAPAFPVGSETSPVETRSPPEEVVPLPRPLVEDVQRPTGASAAPLDLGSALQWTLSNNPDLIAIRQNLCVSVKAAEAARWLPMSLNPGISVDVRPWVYERVPGDGIERLDPQVSVALQQPIELGHRTRYRLSAAQAACRNQQWTIVQAELQAVVQTYRLYQTASYRREKLRVAKALADFNDRLVATLQRQMEANQVPAGDVVLAEVESQATQQALADAKQELVVAVTELRRQIGIGDDARPVEPIGGIQLPRASVADDREALIRASLADQPEILAAQAQLESSRAALCLARADRIPVPSIGPVYERNETGASFYGLALSSPIPILNSGTPLVRQREAECRRDAVALEQLRQRTALQIEAAWVKWDQALGLVARTTAIHRPIQAQAARMDRLYEAGQTDLVKLLQVRQRLIEAENTELDVVWRATQAYADLLGAVGVTPFGDMLSPSLREADTPPSAAAFRQP
jgi:outer membrane protein, heavy metal efflux system